MKLTLNREVGHKGGTHGIMVTGDGQFECKDEIKDLGLRFRGPKELWRAETLEVQQALLLVAGLQTMPTIHQTVTVPVPAFKARYAEHKNKTREASSSGGFSSSSSSSSIGSGSKRDREQSVHDYGHRCSKRKIASPVTSDEDSEGDEDVPMENLLVPRENAPLSTLTDDDIKRMRVAELRVELSQRGLDAKGLKATLKERLDAGYHGGARHRACVCAVT